MIKRGARTPGRPGDRRASGPRTAALALAALAALAAPSLAERWLPLTGQRGERTESADPRLRLRAERRAEVEALTAPLRQGLALPAPEAKAALRAGEADTARVMVCLLAFRTNRRPDLTTVPADGKFMAAADTLPDWLRRVDPPPHDAAYFAAHMRALREFYRIQSYGRLEIDWEIVPGPAADGGLFLLPDPADYGPGAGGYWTLELLEAFMRAAVDSIDATLQADALGPRFADFDHVMVFHAGSDLQNDIYGDSPNDLPSFNIFFGDPPLVDGGAHALGSVLLLPETTTQDTDPGAPIYGALNAVTAHEFGHQLDLADTYDTYYGWPSVGYWDLMDSGHQILFGFQTTEDPEPIYVYGALPTSFSIWHRMLLGWVNSGDGSLLRPGGGEHALTLTACNVQAPGAKALRVDLSEREYYVLENRQELLHEGGRYVKRDAATGVFQFVSIDFPAWPDSAANSGEYDLFLPQSGLLAWHVDERNFETLYPLNIINLYGDKHVRLVEADGTQDLGDPYAVEWRGGERDPFYTGNVAEWLEDGVPDTRLYDGTASGFRLTELLTSPYLLGDAVDSTITFRVARAGIPAGLPRDDREALPGALAVLPAAGSLLPLADGAALWLGYAMDSLDPDTLLQTHLIFSGSRAEALPPLAPQAPRRLSGTLAGSALLEAPGVSEPFWCLLTSDSLLGWGPPAAGAAPAELFALALPAPPATLPLALFDSASAQGRVLWLGEDEWLNLLSIAYRRGQPEPGALSALSLGPRARGEGERAPAFAPLALVQTGAGPRVAVAVGDSLTLVDPFGAGEPQRLGLPDPGEGPFWIRPVDLDGDGAESPAEVFWIHVDGRVVTLGESGWTPRFTAPLESGRLSADPIVADLDGDGRPEFLLADGDRVHRLSSEGFAYADWPLRLGELADLEEPMRIGSGLRAADLTGDGIAELVLVGDSGHLLVVGADGRPRLGTPRSLAAAPVQDLISLGGEVFAISRDGFLLGFTGLPSAGAPEWGAGGGGFARTGRWERRHAIADAPRLDAEAWLFYPNPAGSECRLHHPALPAGTRVRLELFDLEGQLKFTREELAAADGPFEIPLELRSLAAGVYFGRIEAGGRHCLRRLAVLR